MTSRWPAMSASIASLNDIGDVSITSATLFDRLEYDGALWRNVGPIQEVITVGKANAMYTTITAALAAITDASAAKPYVIRLAPGIYTENVTLKDDVTIVGDYWLCPTIVGKVDASGTNASMCDVRVSYTAAADNDIALHCGDGFFRHCIVVLTVAADYTCHAVKVTQTVTAAFQAALLDVGVGILDTGSTSKDLVGIEVAGTGKCLIADSAVELTSTATTSGNHVGFLFSGGNEVAGKGNRIYFDHSGGTFTGTACFRKCTKAYSPAIFQGTLCKGVGDGTNGTIIAFCMDTPTNNGTWNENGASYNINGYGTEYAYETLTGDTQAIRSATINKAIDGAPTSTGFTLFTPYDDNKTGFLAWEDGAANFYTISTTVSTDDTFTVEAAGIGYIKSTPRKWAGSQSVTLTANATNYIYVDEGGTVRTTTNPDSDHNGNNIYDFDISLFQVWYSDGGAVTAAIPVKENHPYEFDTAVSQEWHDVFGSVLDGDGAVISTLDAGNRTIQSTGASILYDHGLRTTIPDSTGVAITWDVVYTTAGGAAALDAQTTQLAAEYNNAGTPTAANSFVVYRLGVSKDDLEGTVQYFAVMHTEKFSTKARANAAIADGDIAAFPSEIAALEVARVGYVVIRGSTNAIVEMVPDKKTAITASIQGGSANSANLISTDTASFLGWLEATDPTVQQALQSLSNLGGKGTVQTTDATTTDLATLAIPTNTADTMQFVVSAFEPSTGDCKCWELTYKVKNVAGTVTVEKMAEHVAEDAGASAWTAVLAVDGTDVDVQVTGEVAHTINWNTTIRRANYSGV
jgi:hypothetical protein